jgi:hypothetical protein
MKESFEPRAVDATEETPAKLGFPEARRFEAALERLEGASRAGKALHQTGVYDAAVRLLKHPEGVPVLASLAHRFEAAGVFAGTDWDHPGQLQARLVRHALTGEPRTVAIEAMSELRFVAIAREGGHGEVDAEAATDFLKEILALNLDLLFDRATESTRMADAALRDAVSRLAAHIADFLPASELYGKVIDEIEAILQQRPIQVGDVKAMITRMVMAQHEGHRLEGSAADRAHRLSAALFAPTALSAGDPGIDAYAQALAEATPEALRLEALSSASLMHETGLVSDYHAVLLRYLRDEAPDLLADAMGLGETGRQCLIRFRALVFALIDRGIFPATSQGIYGLARLLDAGVLYFHPVVPGLWRQMGLRLAPEVRSHLTGALGPAADPEAHLLAGILNVLGQPLGVGQGNNPTCQSARAIALFAQNSPDYLLQLMCWAARDGEIGMIFEGDAISSRDLEAGLLQQLDIRLDPVSLLLVPHLDRIYAEMGRRVIGREEDGHQWINPEFHGWWVNRGCRTALDPVSRKVTDFAGFVRHFYATYHPDYNRDQPVIHPQPAGIASTSALGTHIGWHAISIQRLDRGAADGEVRVYFHNPNNEKRQEWGDGIVTSIQGHGELPGESSLPVAEFVSRLYLFHYDPLEEGDPESVPQAEVDRIEALAKASWAADLEWL